jgi:signal transduction histidine kinase
LAVLLAGAVLQAALSTAEHRALAYSLAFVLYTVAVQNPRRVGLLALEASLLAWVTTESLMTHQLQGLVRVCATSGLVIAAGWSIGLAVRQQRAYGEGLRRQAEHRVEERITEERLRIARELHDIVAHSMSLIAVQAGVARYVGDAEPEGVARALGSIEATSRSALDEMRRLLGVLRATDGSQQAPELAPMPRLADLEQLATATTEAGVAVRLRNDGEPPELPPGVELAAYRIVQEALTNVLKHAAARRAEVLTAYRDGRLRIEVTDDGVGALRHWNGRPGGHGLDGMRERVAYYDGELTAGPVLGGGFRVTATIPVPRSELPAAELVAP